jgi:cellulose synthase (UDP-forming)
MVKFLRGFPRSPGSSFFGYSQHQAIRNIEVKPLKPFYFSSYESRTPHRAVRRPEWLTLLFQFLGPVLIVLGVFYLWWRWTHSVNWEAAWFSVPLALAETLSFVATVLVVFNYWEERDTEPGSCAHMLSDIEDISGAADRPLSIDVFIATYNEDPELVRYSIRDALAMRYPHGDVGISVWVLDDGNRAAMRAAAAEEGARYLSRSDNHGYKAGNLRNGLLHSSGDLFVILDADTRPFPDFLIHTTGYFRNRKLAWVQTPQWFYDLTEPVRLTTFLRGVFGLREPERPNLSDRTIGLIRVGRDVFGNDPRIFYDVILRRRNRCNAAFSCGAGSVYRRKAVMEHAEYRRAEEAEQLLMREAGLTAEELPADSAEIAAGRRKLEQSIELRPFVYHASEDIYTSLLLHAHPAGWQSVQHPQVECKMLSPQDLEGCVKQRTRYASGSLEIAVHRNPLTMKGLSFGQRLSYFQTVYSYFAPVWLIVFLLSPAVFFLTLTPPVSSFNFDFFRIFIPFQVLNIVTMTIGTWGIPTKRADQYYVAGFAVSWRALVAVIRGEKVKFHVTRKTGFTGRNLIHVMPHLLISFATIAGISYNIVLIRNGTHPSYSGFAANLLWSLFNLNSLGIMIMAALWRSPAEPQES